MLLMLQGHVCDTLLLKAEKSTEFFRLYWNLRGITGPLFYTLGGFAFVVASDSRWAEYGRPGPRLYARLRRAGLLMLIGYALQMPRWHGRLFFDFSEAEWTYLLRSGVLHCVGWSMILCHVLIAVAPTRRIFTVLAAGAAFAVLFATPALADAPLERPLPLAMLLHTRGGSLFPLFPYIAYFFFGAVLGRLHLDWKRLGSAFRIGLPLVLFGAAMIFGASQLRASDLLRSLQPLPPLVDPSLFLLRLGASWLALGAFGVLLARVKRSPAWLADLGGRALAVYVAHLVILYGVPKIPGLVQRIGPTLSLEAAFVGGPLLLVASAVASILFDRAVDGAKWLVARGFRPVRRRLPPAVSAAEPLDRAPPSNLSAGDERRARAGAD